MDKAAEKSYFVKQLELYSNSIIGFIVVQGLAYCYKFGSDVVFSTAIKKTFVLSTGLTIALSITMGLGLYANYVIAKRMVTMVDSENRDLVQQIFKGKSIVIVLFGLLPIVVTVYFGIIEGMLNR